VLNSSEILYKKYKDARDAAWNTLILFNVDKLPVSVGVIFKKLGITVGKYSNKEMPIAIKRSDLAETALLQRAFTVYSDNNPLVFYNEATPISELRFSLAHELGHLLLSHSPSHWNQNAPTRKSIEIDANRFAVRLLSPACVLKEMNITDKNEIAKLCGLPLSEAGERAKRLKALAKRNLFLKSELEKQVLEQFYPILPYSSNNSDKSPESTLPSSLKSNGETPDSP